jgi:hypothetical protein
MAKTRLRRPTLSAVIEIFGLEWVIKEAGAEELVEKIGPRRVVGALGGPEPFLAMLSPSQRRQLKRLLEK